MRVCFPMFHGTVFPIKMCLKSIQRGEAFSPSSRIMLCFHFSKQKMVLCHGLLKNLVTLVSYSFAKVFLTELQ